MIWIVLIPPLSSSSPSLFSSFLRTILFHFLRESSKALLSISANSNIVVGWSQFFLWSPVPPISFPNLWRPFQGHQLELLSLLCSCSTTFLALWQDSSTYQSFHFILFSVCWNYILNKELKKKSTYNRQTLLCRITVIFTSQGLSTSIQFAEENKTGFNLIQNLVFVWYPTKPNCGIKPFYCGSQA